MRKELLLFFVWRDFVIRYKQAFLGVFWALIRPIFNMLIFMFIFQKIANVETESPYPFFVLAGLLPWQCVASCIQSSSMCLIQNMVLIQKASFPRIFLPMSACIVNLFDMLLALVLFLGALIFLNPPPLDRLIFLPCMVALLGALCLGISFWFSALTARFKDLVIAIPYVIQVGIFLCPIGFSTYLFPESAKALFYLNPLVGIIDGFRWCLLGEGEILISVTYSVLITLFLGFTGYRYFKKVELHLADIL